VSIFEPQAPFVEPDRTPARSIVAAAAPTEGWARTPPGDVIAPEIAFLAGFGVPREALLAATRTAGGGVSPEQAFLGGGHMREEDFYRLLAAHLGLSYYVGEFAIVGCADPAQAAMRGGARLAPNAGGARAVLAPRGRALTLLLLVFAAGRLPRSFVITSPQTLGGVVRRQMGRQVAEQAASALEMADPRLTAHPLFAGGRIGWAILLALGALWAGALISESFAASCAVVLWLAFAASAALRLAATAAAGRPAAEAAALDDADLPTYSIIAPLYREARMAPRLVRALEAIDYPKARLDVKIVIERDDRDTLVALAKLQLPAWYDVIVAPPGAPATKPRALNVALPFARGDLIVVYDAEDIPAPDQLRRAAARFATDATIECLQARLAIHNADDGWIPKLFAIEYAALFDVVNPGLAALGAPIALGGSSNHFRTRTLRRVGQWDAWNVTEDADLGLRLARFGLRVATMDSDTFEEAPSRLGNWFGQRRRWHKGWVQTLAVHSRSPRRLVREFGWARALAAQALMLGPVLGGLLGPALVGFTLWRWLEGQLFTSRSVGAVVGDALSLTLMLAGSAAILLPIALALRGRGLLRLCLWLPLLPLYYCLVSLAAWAALIDLARRPFHWWKTEHGQTPAAAERPPAGALARADGIAD
jgi:cellulose synthase/poly-beta-1,6-N-acetylglucosamine synthase-like glycosyltransferase